MLPADTASSSPGLPRPCRKGESIRCITSFFPAPAAWTPIRPPCSEVYQDLFGLGTYSGKGLYEVDSFETALAGRVPENALLSHDLFESVFARCAFVSDIELFEEFPSRTEVAASRSHRWARGDWQLLPWIFGPRGKDMPLIGRWKMLDNLRRTLSAPGAFLTLLAAWAIPSAPLLTMMGMVLAALAFPTFQSFIGGMRIRTDVALRKQLRVAAENITLGFSNSLVMLTLLVQQALLMTDAIASTLVRLISPDGNCSNGSPRCR